MVKRKARGWLRPLLLATAVTSVSGLAADSQSEQDVREFIDQAGQRSTQLSLEGTRAEWVFQNFITHDTQQIAVSASKKSTIEGGNNARQARDYLALPGLSQKT